MENFQISFLFRSPVHRHDARKFLIADCFLNSKTFSFSSSFLFLRSDDFLLHKSQSPFHTRQRFSLRISFAFLSIDFLYRTISIAFAVFLLVRSLAFATKCTSHANDNNLFLLNRYLNVLRPEEKLREQVIRKLLEHSRLQSCVT